MADQPSTFMLMLRLGLSLGLVLALVGGITWVLRRRGLLAGGLGGKSTGRLQILDRKSLNKHASLVVARVGDTSVLLGVTEQNVTVLSDSDGLGAGWYAPAGTATPHEQPAEIKPAEIKPAETEPAGIKPTGSKPAEIKIVGARRTGTPVSTKAVATDSTGMSFVEALRELTVRRS
ncbi:MAG: flagellar biosynthetic protein FliO [Microthrixaceae bacterium]